MEYHIGADRKPLLWSVTVQTGQTGAASVSVSVVDRTATAVVAA